MIYAIYPCPVSFCPLDSFSNPPNPPTPHFAPWKSFNVHYFPIPVSFCPPIILPPWKLFHDLHYLPMSSIILPPGLILPPYHFVPIIPVSFAPCIRLRFHTTVIKSPLQQKLMTGAHPVTVAPLVNIYMYVKHIQVNTKINHIHFRTEKMTREMTPV